jgi:hypothetical protein
LSFFSTLSNSSSSSFYFSNIDFFLSLKALYSKSCSFLKHIVGTSSSSCKEHRQWASNQLNFKTLMSHISCFFQFCSWISGRWVFTLS